jgi:precorrin-6B methylase 2
MPHELDDLMAQYEPFIPTPKDLIAAKLESAGVRPGEVVYDLGSGDGGVLIEAALRYDARGVGFEVLRDLVERSNARIRALNLEHRITVHYSDFMQADISRADIVVLYLNRGTLGILSGKLQRELKSGARIVTHAFDLPGWTERNRTRVTGVNGQAEEIYLYVQGWMSKEAM